MVPIGRAEETVAARKKSAGFEFRDVVAKALEIFNADADGVVDFDEVRIVYGVAVVAVVFVACSASHRKCVGACSGWR